MGLLHGFTINMEIWELLPSGKLSQFAMERSTIFNGKTHYFYGNFQ